MSAVEYGELLAQTVLQESIRKEYLSRFIMYKIEQPGDIKKLVAHEGAIYTKHIGVIRSSQPPRKVENPQDPADKWRWTPETLRNMQRMELILNDLFLAYSYMYNYLISFYPKADNKE